MMGDLTTSFPATTLTTNEQPHVVVCSGAGMGHLIPFLNLASTLSSAPYRCKVTLLIVIPLITDAESHHISSFFSSHPTIHRLDFHVNLPAPKPNVDPFFLRYKSISDSAHRLPVHLSTLAPPISAVFSDFLFTQGLNTTLPHLPNYTFTTTSARFFTLMSYVPHLAKSSSSSPVEIPGLEPFPTDNIPPPFFNPDHIFTSFTISNANYLSLSKGIIVNTFDSFEPETLSALNSGDSLPDLPPVIPIGPLNELEHNKQEELLPWLDQQPEKSVLYVSFGNRTAMSSDQILELGMGLERSDCRFIWVVKTSKIDKDDKSELRKLFGEELYVKLSEKGKLVKWVNQTEILGHTAVGGFLSHCGWNSVMEAARRGVPILAWPQHGDQRENAWVVEKAGLGVWEREWSSGIQVAIVEKVKMIMGNNDLRNSAVRVGEEAKRACDVGGSSATALMNIIGSLKR
uniref:UDP-glycosyltransferase 708C2 n=1 Tax=Fagopyrum esculentum TaxID=3617 RepID=708C2_FAGES|nr:RecName: Full=UDP-glycosyltransferase 708C2; AltName: Full=C-glucosyltransferase b; Short=FeCGTb; AltName: Full=UDP-glucose:2-hydroxyflavanone C-glucosyltransferase [Fagopyrum esculentum]BAP90361.1 UDP-glucose: 2-hydroxyflavanone C-glucosyltransferase UGT708C2 [Fagopyrum esculentum]